MGNIGVSSTTLADPRAAAKQLAAAACAGLPDRPTLAILFATADYDTETLVSGVDQRLGGVPTWGGSSMGGVFANDEWVTAETGAAALMLITGWPGGAAMRTVGDDPKVTGKLVTRKAIEQAGARPSAILTLAFMGPEEKLLAGVAQAAPGVPVVGGSASDASGRFQQYGRGHVAKNAFTVAALGGEVGYAFAHGYRPTGYQAAITRVEGRRVMELDHRPALDVYAEWNREEPAEVRGGAILSYSVFHPFLLHRNGDTLAVHPMNGNDDGSIDTGVTMTEGMILELGAGTLDEVINAVAPVVLRAAANVKQPSAVILAHCGGRAIGLGEHIKEVASQVRQAVGELPWIGYLAFGEQGCYRPGNNAHGNLSLSALVLG